MGKYRLSLPEGVGGNISYTLSSPHFLFHTIQTSLIFCFILWPKLTCYSVTTQASLELRAIFLLGLMSAGIKGTNHHIRFHYFFYNKCHVTVSIFSLSRVSDCYGLDMVCFPQVHVLEACVRPRGNHGYR